jgi:hypothetical protein
MSEINQDGETVVVSVDERVSISAEKSRPQNFFDQSAERITWFLLFILPILFIPVINVPFEAGKKYIFTMLLVVVGSRSL